MIARSPRERELYEARLKMQRDEQSRIAAAKDQGHAAGLEEGLEQGLEKGREEGLEKGCLVGRIQLLENLLGLSESSSVELNSQPLAALSQMASDLQKRLHSAISRTAGHLQSIEFHQRHVRLRRKPILVQEGGPLRAPKIVRAFRTILSSQT